MTNDLRIDLAGTPFSRRGSYFALSKLDQRHARGLFLRTVHGGVRQAELMRFVVGGDDAPLARVEPGRLTLRGGDSEVEVALEGSGRALVRLMRGTVVLEAQVLSQYDVVLQESAGVWRFIASGANRNYRIVVFGGESELDTGWDGVKGTATRLILRADTQPVTVTVDEFASTPPEISRPDVDAVIADAERDFAGWAARHGHETDDPGLLRAVRLAAFVTWAALVPAGGALRRESMLMSKNWMTNVWAWDHCFNALALWRDPDAAAGQLLTLFDHQDVHGSIPDYVNDLGIEPNFVKPPVHGWAIGFLLDRNGLTRDAVEQLYEPLAGWTRWWFEYRVYGDDGVPSYNHGNDSGWDNSTVFGGGVPVQSPDLPAFLAVQMTTLARMAELLGRDNEAERWRRESGRTMRMMLERFWTGERFVARHTLTQDPIESDSLLTFMPLVLGDDLPRAVVDRCVERLLDGAYLTVNGLATEPTDSAHYIPDGYWRGPIWAPSTMLLVDGLHRAGHRDLADDIAGRFVRMCIRHGMAENFDAVTGNGLRDLSMTWTASVFLTLVAAPATHALLGTATATDWATHR
ncbi:amylo-alpha-1,6-glucosidase [Jiangella endophytica]|uniref:amylo-alpha-1,6-glucosidase n=1 Tax=Jiangella endophytica TaxID=1623398 RepID=UPI00130034FE|nr:trehalase family glycosidase [Jiangella endophytica]